MMGAYIQKYLKVDEYNTVAYREYGNPYGVPVLFLHGGPGGTINYSHLELIDLSFYHVFTIDQRGCGDSLPKGSLVANTLTDLVHDMEQIRKLENLGKCIIFGRSWGALLGLMYALKYPQNCRYLILRSLFLGRHIDETWTFEGSRAIYPEQWKVFCEGLEPHRALNLQYYDKLFNSDIETALAYSAKMTYYFNILASNNPNISLQEETMDNLLANKIFLHYSINGYFFEDTYLAGHLSELDKNGIKGVIIHGQKDNDCPIEQAYYLHKNWHHSKLIVEPMAFHCDSQPEIRKHIKIVFEAYKELLG